MYATGSLLSSLPTSLKILNLADTGNCFDAGDARQPQLRARQAMLWPSLAAGFTISTFAASLIFDTATRQYGATVAGTLAIGMYLFGCSNVAIDCCMSQDAGPDSDANAQLARHAATSSESETVILNERTPPATSVRRSSVSEDTRVPVRTQQAPSLHARLYSRSEKHDGSTLVLASTCVAAGAGTLIGALVERSAQMLIGTAAGGVGGALLGVVSLSICRFDCDKRERSSQNDSDGETSEFITLSSTDSDDSRDDAEAVELAATDSLISGDSSTVSDDSATA